MKLSDQLLDALDGGEECRGRDAQLTEWARLARELERLATIIGMCACQSCGAPLQWSHSVNIKECTHAEPNIPDCVEDVPR